MKVYIVVSGEYSDYHIESVFTDQNKAELYCATHNKGNAYEPYFIEEWETEDSKIESNEIPKRIWYFYESGRGIIFTGGYLTFEEKEDFNRQSNGNWWGKVTVEKNTPEETVKKIVTDKLAKHKAEYALER